MSAAMAAQCNMSIMELQCCTNYGSSFLLKSNHRISRKHYNQGSRCFRVYSSKQPLSTKQNIERNSNINLNKQAQPRIPYGLITALSSIGAIETAYLSWIKLFGDGTVVCPTGGPGCNDVLNSVYSTVFGVPLSLIGLVAYSSISILGLTMINSMFAEEDIRWVFLGGTTALASASTFFMYLLAYKLDGASCTYCVASALLSLALFFSTLKGFKWKDAPQMAGLQVAVGAVVIVALSTAFASSSTALAGSGDIDLPPIEPEITTSSDATKMSLAKHLKSVGAKMYGAFWCSHCHEQKQTLGKEAMKIVDYVECFPEGYRRGVQMEKACQAAKIEGFPTWIIKDKAYSGDLSLQELADAAGFSLGK